MIDFQANLDEFERFGRDLLRAPEVAHKHLRRAFGDIGQRFLARHRKDRLSGRPGLNRVDGGLINGRQVVVEGATLNTLDGEVFIGPPANRYARIHELGTVGAGGSEPDIVPKRAKALRFEIDGATFFAKRVKIPKRLGWYDTWDGNAEARTSRLRHHLEAMTKEIAG